MMVRVFVLCLIVLTRPAVGAGLPEIGELPARDALPDPLISFDGSATGAAEWPARRDEIVELLLHYEYGHMPPAPDRVVAIDATDSPALEGAATLRHFRLRVGDEGAFAFEAGVLIPAKGNGPFPVILAIDPVFQSHVIPTATQVIERGYAFAGFVYHDIDNDNANRSDGVCPHYPGNDWGTIAAWAWAAMRMVDYLQTVPEIDSARIVITGHSRCGKAALLAGALDTRIAIVAPHSSGAGGSGSYRVPQKGCETLADITDPERFHYWFHPRLREFAGHEDRLPFDQHFLMALVAPRRLYSMETRDDHWSNPEGAARMVEAARPVFRLLEAPTRATLYMRPGGHDTTAGDWDALLGYADRAFR
jgi:dienelactone hydrolase